MGKVQELRHKIHIASCSFGKDSIATILLALENNEPLDRVVFAEVMFDHERGISGEIPEHIEWIYSTAIPKLAKMGVKVDVVKSKKDYIHFFVSAVGGGGIKARFTDFRLAVCA
jgi:3'-phosphoadenosine 5'-phosphosulfate sulfotransferase (PAPS reductase)/FAD synthetase